MLLIVEVVTLFHSNKSMGYTDILDRKGFHPAFIDMHPY